MFSVHTVRLLSPVQTMHSSWFVVRLVRDYIVCIGQCVQIWCVVVCLGGSKRDTLKDILLLHE
jgi:hypothetical protein